MFRIGACCFGVWLLAKVFENIKLDRLHVFLSHDVTSWSNITPCNKIDKPLVVFRFCNVT